MSRHKLEEVIEQLRGEAAAARELEVLYEQSDTPRQRLLRARERLAYETCVKLLREALPV
jgi:hypothetical protein